MTDWARADRAADQAIAAFLNLPPAPGRQSRYRRPDRPERGERDMSCGAYDDHGSLRHIRDIERDGK